MSWLSLFLFLIMLAIMFFQTIHGMFSALIMAVICVLSATVALGAHEQLAQSLLTGVIGDYAYPVSFVGIFGLAVLGVRVLVDMIVARNTLLPGYVDKLGSAVFGIITGLITAGVMGIGIQMIPFGSTILGFQRFDREDKPHHTLWLNPDAFTLRLCSYLSDYTLSGDAQWAEIHPDFLTELYWLRNTTSGGSRISVGPESVKVVGDLKKIERLYRLKRSARRRGTDTFEDIDGPPPGKLWLVVGVKVGEGGADSDGRYRYSRTQVRLVGDTEGGGREQYTLKAVGPFGDRYVLTEPEPLAEAEPLWGNSTGEFDFVFEVPTDFTPSFVAFKRAGRARMPKWPAEGVGGLALITANAPSSLPVSSASADADPPRNQRRGSTTPVRPQKQGSHFGDKMPMEIRRYAGTTIDSRGSVLARGQLALLVEKQEEQQGRRGRGRNQDPDRTMLDSFDVPSGLHLLHLNVEALHARSILGGTLNLARRVLQQYRVIDTKGQDYWPVGLIAECDSGGEREMEIQYFPEESEFQRALRSFTRIKYNELTGDYRFVLLFFVPEGVELEKFDSGRKTVDISDLNLVAGG